MGIDVLMADVSSLSDSCLFERAFALMPAYRREKISRMHFDKDQRLSLGVGMLLRMGLISRGMNPDIHLGENDFGKPFFADHRELHFNLSHSGTMALAAFGDTPLGCDVEMHNERHVHIAKRFFTPSEQALISSEAAENDTIRMFFRLWTLKESFLKATGYGITYGLDRFAVTFENNRPVLIDGVSTTAQEEGPSVNLSDYTLCELAAPEGYCAALCTAASSCPDVTVHQIGFEEILSMDPGTVTIFGGYS